MRNDSGRVTKVGMVWFFSAVGMMRVQGQVCIPFLYFSFFFFIFSAFPLYLFPLMSFTRKGMKKEESRK